MHFPEEAIDHAWNRTRRLERGGEEDEFERLLENLLRRRPRCRS